MKIENRIKVLFLANTFGLITLSCTLTQLGSAPGAEARGGGGRGGGFAGGRGVGIGVGFSGGRDAGFGGQEGFRAEGERGYGDRAFENGYGDRGLDRGYIGGGEVGGLSFMQAGRGEGAMPHANENELRSAADHEYTSTRQQGLSTDGGFGRLSTEYAGTATGHNFSQTRPLAQADLVDHGVGVRSNFARLDHPLFDRNWWNNHNGWWGYDGWGYGWWGGVGWDDLAGYWGLPDLNAPVEYDYGNNIIYQGDQVYYGSQPMASTMQYYQQAQTLANSAPPIPTTIAKGLTKVSGDWKPLGVFSLTQPGDSNPNTIFQLAVNKAGVISGNYYNTLNDQSTPIKGKVDKKSMRAAFIVGKNKDVVYDTGLANLLEPQSTILVHLNKNRTQQELFVRLDPPKSDTPAAAKGAS